MGGWGDGRENWGEIRQNERGQCDESCNAEIFVCLFEMPERTRILVPRVELIAETAKVFPLKI